MTIAQNLLAVIEENDFGTVGTDLFLTAPNYAQTGIWITQNGGASPNQQIGRNVSAIFNNYTITIVKATAQSAIDTAQDLIVVLAEGYIPGVLSIRPGSSSAAFEGDSSGRFYVSFDLALTIARDQIDAEYVIDGGTPASAGQGWLSL